MFLSVVVLVIITQGCQFGSAFELCGSPGWPVPSQPKGVTLKQVTAVIRHGDRVVWNGSQCWPGDNSVWSCDLSQFELPTYWPSQYTNKPVPRLYEKVYLSYDEVMHGNCSVAQLTTKGYMQHQANGRSLHEAYVKTGFLSNTLDPNNIYLRSDDISRTLQSAESLVLSMFPINSSNQSHNTATISLLPLYTRDTTYDYMSSNPLLCPRVALYSQQFKQSTVWKEHYPKTRSLFEKIKNTTGIDMNEDTFLHFSDCLCTHHCHDLSMPKGMTDDLLESVWAENSWQFYSLFKYPSVEENARVSIGFLLKDIWKNLNNSVNGIPVQKFFLFSGHDTTIMPLLVALRVDDGHWAPYASMILIELYQTKDKKSLVRFIYNGKVLSPPFCGDTELCDYDKLSNYLTTVTPPNNYKDTLCKI